MEDVNLNIYRKLGYFGRSFILVYLVPLFESAKIKHAKK